MDAKIKDTAKLFFSGMRPLEMSEFALMGLMVIVLPFDWQLVMWLMPLYIINALARIVASRRLGNSSLSVASRWSLWLMVAFYGIQLISMLYTSNLSDGWSMLSRRLPILLFVLCCLAVDTAYLTRTRLRTLLWAFTLSLVVKFIVRLAIMFVVKHKFVFGSSFDPLHHTYMSMYLLFALGFLYSEWHFHRSRMSAAMKWFFYAAVVVLTAYMVMVQSRTGIAGLAVMVVAVIVHQLFVLKDTRRGLLMLAAVVVVGAGVYFLLPDSSHRLTKTLDEMSEGDTSDVRFRIYGGSLKAVGQNMPFGVGIGDKNEVLAEIYDELGISSSYNSHNIYLDVAVTTGIPGILLLLAALVVPTVMALRRRDIVLLSLVFSFAFCGLFEAILNRQMGIMFVGLFWLVVMASGHKEVES